MAENAAVAEALTQHVFGPDDPSVSLLDTGAFPSGWVKEYRQLLTRVAEEWSDATVWPRLMVGALHYALTHLRVRYSAWQRFDGGGRKNELTENDLIAVEAPTRKVFALAFPRQGISRNDQP